MPFHCLSPRPKKSPLTQVLAAGFIPIRYEVARLMLRALNSQVQLTPNLDVLSQERFAQILEETRLSCGRPVDPAAWMIELSEAVFAELRQKFEAMK